MGQRGKQTIGTPLITMILKLSFIINELMRRPCCIQTYERLSLCRTLFPLHIHTEHVFRKVVPLIPMYCFLSNYERGFRIYCFGLRLCFFSVKLL